MTLKSGSEVTQGRKSPIFPPSCIYSPRWILACDRHPPSHTASHVAVASTRYAYLRRAVKMRANGLLGPQYAASRHTTSQSATLGLHPVIHVPNFMDHYSFTDPWGMGGWVGHVDWPIASWSTHSASWCWSACPETLWIVFTYWRGQYR